MSKTINNKILYLSFHNSLKKKFGVNRIIPVEEILIKLGRQYLVPKSLRKRALMDLEHLGLLHREDKHNFRILSGGLDMGDTSLTIKRR